ncbi:polysaccharide biosynthesis/export family protein [Methylobacterium sp. NMS14P]|uniref:polysaccharide biosynthesis/export family protein n=1 Tax=Methylobacterium sp. NMS14P TaxID=2894310 RepID=UPI00235889C9|nr:polysaccharide biosynthesis/export family protein [Methylobacterium sp. NMS14P]WCS24356.1 polysaccharide biosynthesis/export family protein [Methylobacterium sp. NMS14P]
MRLRSMAAGCLVLFGSSLAAAAADEAGRYVLGPQDHLTIRVYDLRRNTGEAYSWTALNGQFVVAADGTVSMPLIGQIKAAGGTPVDLANAIGVALKQVADLAEKPAASVEVATYRPFYIIGAVQQPGKYEYQPGLTVLQAVSTAQGLMRGTDPRGIQRDAVTSRGELRNLAAERTGLAAKLARLEAEIAGTDTIAFGTDARGAADKAYADQAVRGEQLLFDTRRNALKAEIKAIEQSVASFENEMSTLDHKSKTLDRQIELSRGELGLINELVSKGLTIAPRKLAAEQSQASFESGRLDVQVAMLRAQQSLTRAERDLIDLKARFRREALSEAAETRQKLALIDEKTRTAERLTTDAEAQMIGSTDDASEGLSPRYEITRKQGAKAGTWLASEDVVVEPGDVVRVTLARQPADKSGETRQPPMPRRGSGSAPVSRGPAAPDAPQRPIESANR